MIGPTVGELALVVPLVVDQIQEALSEDGMTIALVALVFLFCLYTFVKGFGLFREAYKIKSRDATPANEVYLADGVVEVEGTAEVLDETVQSPYTNTDCLVYEYKKERDDGHTGDDTHDSGMTTVDSGSEEVPFLIADGTGDVAVDPTGAEFTIGTDDVEGGTREKKHENRIEPGNPIHVTGQKREAAEQRDDGLDHSGVTSATGTVSRSTVSPTDRKPGRSWGSWRRVCSSRSSPALSPSSPGSFCSICSGSTSRLRPTYRNRPNSLYSRSGSYRRKKRLLASTETLEKAIAAAASTGCNSPREASGIIDVL